MYMSQNAWESSNNKNIKHIMKVTTSMCQELYNFTWIIPILKISDWGWHVSNLPTVTGLVIVNTGIWTEATCHWLIIPPITSFLSSDTASCSPLTDGWWYLLSLTSCVHSQSNSLRRDFFLLTDHLISSIALYLYKFQLGSVFVC